MSGARAAVARKAEVEADKRSDDRSHEGPENAVGVPRFLQGLVQTKLVVGAPDDGFERGIRAIFDAP